MRRRSIRRSLGPRTPGGDGRREREGDDFTGPGGEQGLGGGFEGTPRRQDVVDQRDA
jgi:hypothetical protein